MPHNAHSLPVSWLRLILLSWSTLLVQQGIDSQEPPRPPAQGRFAFSVPVPTIGANFGQVRGRLGVMFPLWALYFDYAGGFFIFNDQVYPLYGAGASWESQVVRVSVRATQTPMDAFFPYLSSDSSFHGGEGIVGLRLGGGAIDLSGIFRMGFAKTRNYLDDNRLLLLSTVQGNALIERDVLLELRAVLSFDWLRDIKDQQGKFALRGSVPLRMALTSDSMLLWYLTPYFGYIRPTQAGADKGILTDFLYAPNSKIRGDSTAGIESELRLYPLRQTMVPILEDTFIAAIGSIGVYHLSPKRLTQLEEHYRFGGAVGLKFLKAILVGAQVDYAPVEQWQIHIYMKGET